MLIKLTDINGGRHYVAVHSIARVTEAGVSSQWHGVRAYVTMTDNTTLEIRESVDRIVSLIDGGKE